MIFKALFKKKEPQSNERRRAYRVAIKDLNVTVHGKASTFTFTVKDLSASGLGINSQAKAFQPGVMIRLDLCLGGETVVKEIVAKVVRTASGVVGCQFVNPSKAHETVLHELVLNEQKRQAQMRKKQGEAGVAMTDSMEGSLTFIDPWSKKKAFFSVKDE